MYSLAYLHFRTMYGEGQRYALGWDKDREILPHELHYLAHISRLPVIVAARALRKSGWGFEYVSLQRVCEGLRFCELGRSRMEGVGVMGIYVVQVAGGQEACAAEMIARHAQGAVEDCFIPKWEVMRRQSGQWHRKLEKLFPGYVFVQTNAPELLCEALRRVPAFTRMLTFAGDACLPLSDDEVAWIKATTSTDTHVMEMSEGIIEGDRVVVTRGPLKGREASIARVDRHKRLAWVDMNMFGRNKTIRVGLEIVSKR